MQNDDDGSLARAIQASGYREDIAHLAKMVNHLQARLIQLEARVRWLEEPNQ